MLLMIGIDPGETTGVAWWTQGGRPESFELPFAEAFKKVDAAIAVHRDHARIACEEATIGLHSLGKPEVKWALWGVGVARY
ncbi:MAG: hypothetical protein GEU90_22210, partial [Gemmatimonas sp.]|nr:hypothetical protein [Gemmatimonas sp.]